MQRAVKRPHFYTLNETILQSVSYNIFSNSVTESIWFALFLIYDFINFLEFYYRKVAMGILLVVSWTIKNIFPSDLHFTGNDSKDSSASSDVEEATKGAIYNLLPNQLKEL